MANKLWVPVYLPDDTVVGNAVVNVELGTAVIRLQADSNLMELIEKDLVGLQVMYLDRARVEEEQDKQGETTDG